ncbi:MAG: cell division protein FtsH, partial [Candidatus Scalindua sp.]|nr:cell division protein FtsH [Candidatus Scalindua sp.]
VVYGEKEGTIFSGVDPSMNRNYSEETANTIDEFIRKTIGSQLERAKKMLEKNREKLDKLAKILLKKEAISLKEFTEEFTSS